MTIEQVAVVDIISINTAKTQVFLSISDHLEWDEENRKLLILQSKINAYLAYIETGQIYEEKPEAKTLAIVIVLICQYPPREVGLQFLSKVSSIIEEAGFVFQWHVLPGSKSLSLSV